MEAAAGPTHRALVRGALVPVLAAAFWASEWLTRVKDVGTCVEKVTVTSCANKNEWAYANAALIVLPLALGVLQAYLLPDDEATSFAARPSPIPSPCTQFACAGIEWRR